MTCMLMIEVADAALVPNLRLVYDKKGVRALVGRGYIVVGQFASEEKALDVAFKLEHFVKEYLMSPLFASWLAGGMGC